MRNMGHTLKFHVYGRENFTSSGIAMKRHRLISTPALNPQTYRASSFRPGCAVIKFNSTELKYHMHLSLPLSLGGGWQGGRGNDVCCIKGTCRSVFLFKIYVFPIITFNTVSVACFEYNELYKNISSTIFLVDSLLRN